MIFLQLENVFSSCIENSFEHESCTDCEASLSFLYLYLASSYLQHFSSKTVWETQQSTTNRPSPPRFCCYDSSAFVRNNWEAKVLSCGCKWITLLSPSFLLHSRRLCFFLRAWSSRVQPNEGMSWKDKTIWTRAHVLKPTRKYHAGRVEVQIGEKFFLLRVDML